MPEDQISGQRGISTVDGHKILDYVREHGDDLSFTKAFWKDCEPIPYELDRYSKYALVLALADQGTRLKDISSISGVNNRSISKWTGFAQKPKLGHYLSAYLALGPPKDGWVWLSINNTSGHAVPMGQFIQVPKAVSSWRPIENVLSQITPIEPPPSEFTRAYMFGFLLGIAIGDAGKKRQEKWHRHLELILSTRYPTSERIGDFTRQCALAIGLRMKKMLNKERYGSKPHGFFVWESQSSALVDWIFNVCLGLRDDELTTYNPVRMEWALSAPDDFRRGLIQGMAESDGSVNVSGQEVEFWIGPSWDFVKALLKTFGIESFRSREALAISRSQVARALEVPIFSPHLRTVRYQKFVRLATARHIPHGKRLPIGIRSEIGLLAEDGYSVPTISEIILERFGVILTYEAVQRWSAAGLASKNQKAFSGPKSE